MFAKCGRIVACWYKYPFEVYGTTIKDHHHHLPARIRSFDLFWHRRIVVSWGIHGLFFFEVCSWGRVSGVWCCAFFQGGWFSFVCIWVSHLVFQKSLGLFLWLRFLFYPALCTDIGKYSFVNRTIQHWNQLPAEVLGILPANQSLLKRG